MLNPTRPLDRDEAPVVRCPLDGLEEEPVDRRIQQEFLCHIPRRAWDLGIQPRIEGPNRGSGNRSFNRDFNRFSGRRQLSWPARIIVADQFFRHSSLFTPLLLLEIALKLIELLVPEALVLMHPIRHQTKRLRAK